MIRADRRSVAYSIRLSNYGINRMDNQLLRFSDPQRAMQHWQQLEQRQAQWYPFSCRAALYAGDAELMVVELGYIDWLLYWQWRGGTPESLPLHTALMLHVVHMEDEGEHNRWVSLDRPPVRVLSAYDVDQVRIVHSSTGWQFATGSVEITPVESLWVEAEHTLKIVDW